MELITQPQTLASSCQGHPSVSAGKGAGPNGPQELVDGLPWAFENTAYFSKREKFSLPALLGAHAFNNYTRLLQKKKKKKRKTKHCRYGSNKARPIFSGFRC